MISKQSARKLTLITLAAVLSPLLPIAPHLLGSSPEAQAQSPTKLKTQEEAIRTQMVVISRQLGVTCTSCHKTENFKADDLETFRVAKEHIKITQILIDSGMDGQKGHPKADCYMCHRGQLKPDYKEKVDPMIK